MTQLNRRAFVATGASLLALRASRAQEPFKYALKKAVIVGRPTVENLKPIKDAGFDGVETNAILPPDEAARSREAAAQVGVSIHSVLRGWASFNSAKPEEVAASWQQSADALRAAKAYGADAVLLVPCRIGGMAMPQPWEFKVKFDPATGHLTQVVDGDNAPYQDYLAAHDHAWDTSLAQLKKLAAVADETGVVIAVENVWNNLFVDPYHFAAFIDAVGHPLVQVYFDLGNQVKYGPTPDWVRILGRRIAKCHVKDFKLKEDGHGGSFVNIRDGSNDWPAIRRALDAIGYGGWMTIEGGNLSLAEHSQRLGEIIAGR